MNFDTNIRLRGLERTVRGHIESIATFLERYARVFLAGMCVLYLAGTCGRASQKLLWHDELFTLYLARLPHMSDVWTALTTPADGTPPLFHALTRLSVGAFGSGPVALRAPAIVGFLVAMLCLFVFVSRRYGPTYGVVAAVLPLATNAYPYAYEARAYGVVLGLSGVAFVCWQAAGEGGRRRLALTGLLLSVAAAIACHYYAVLLIAAIGAGEAVRLWSRRRADWAMWCVLLFSALAPLAVLLPLIRSAATVTIGWFSQQHGLRVVMEGYEAVLSPLVVPGLAVLVLVLGAAFAANRYAYITEAAAPILRPPGYEWFAMLVLLALPALGAIVAETINASFVWRYALPWVLGFCVVAPFAAAGLLPHRRITGAIMMVILVLWTAGKELSSARLLTMEPPTVAETNPSVLQDRGSALPIAVTHGHTYLPLAAYAPPDIAARLIMLTQPTRITAQIGDAGDKALIGLARWAPLQVQDFDAFVATHHNGFLLYGPPMWLTHELRAAGAHLTLKGEDQQALPFAMSDPGCVFLYEVAFP